MPPFNYSPNHQASSTSTTPPSETTFADEVPIPENPRDSINAQSSQNIQKSEPDCQAINTDYESSAAEDLESYSKIDSKYENAEYALLSYSRTNKLDKLKALLDAKLKDEISLDINFKGQQKQNYSWSALHLACYFGHRQVVDYLLSRKQFREEIDINIQNNSGDTPLHKAVLTNRVDLVQVLLSNSANVFIKNCDGLLAKQLTNSKHILDMLKAAEQVDKARIRQDIFKAVDNGDLEKLQDHFEHYSYYIEASGAIDNLNAVVEENNQNGIVIDEPDGQQPSGNQAKSSISSSELISQMTDERGNTLLHLAAMRGFKAICVYLLEQGLDPYRKNALGQTCIDLASYQLRQLFTTVKPAFSQLKKLSRQRVTRFEGPLLKKVRILGWKQTYVVLENGVFLLFNNRKDSMNRARRGYKYLESASCDTDNNDLGMFTICFSDKSRATFLVTSDHLSNYTYFRSTSHDYDKSVAPGSQVELIRQKWIDSIRDHIKYSTEFIKSGLKFNYDEEEAGNFIQGEDISNLNHLLPIDTIKSFIQEARAHYSILSRHADSLCNLVKSINNSSTLIGSFESSNCDDESHIVENNPPPTSVSPATSATTAGSRLLGFIRPSRQNRGNSIGTEEASSTPQAPQVSSTSQSNRRRNNSLTNEFIQDNWHCILFHLRLLLESSENTKISMGQALALLEHQEQLRQNRIQDQEERCRVLEDSLHALARDHHELEKSLSMSQVYHSVNARSMSISTDLNEYFDAFEDFDDEKTMTPTSMPSDEDLKQKIQDVINEPGMNDKQDKRVFVDKVSKQLSRLVSNYQASSDDTDEDCDDLQSNCSALTETISEHPMIATTGITETTGTKSDQQTNQPHRTRLPAPMIPRDQVSIWSILKNCIGKELSKITMPVVFNEPLTMLQRACEGVQYSRYLKMADESDNPIERMEYVCAFIVACLSANCHRIIKPFNPLLYETYELDYELEDGSHVRTLSQQVSHHPPITAAYSESENFIYNGSVNPKIKFWGRSIEVQPDGQCRVYLKRHKETYIFKAVSCCVHNIIVGKLWFEHRGPLDVKCLETSIQANLIFKQAGWFSNDLHRFDGFIVSGDDKTGEKRKLRFVYGKWSDYIKSVDYRDYENYMKDNPQKLFRIPDYPDQGQSNGLAAKLENLNLFGSPSSVNNNSIPRTSSSDTGSKSLSKSGDKKNAYIKSDSTQSFDIPNSKTLWRLESQYLEEYYSFTLFTMMLNELTPEFASTLPRTDSRFRPDVRKLEEGDLDGAASEKQRLEEKQRATRARDKRFKDPSPELLWFDLRNVSSSKERFWIYKGGYWESKCNPEKFPDLF